AVPSATTRGNLSKVCIKFHPGLLRAIFQASFPEGFVIVAEAAWIVEGTPGQRLVARVPCSTMSKSKLIYFDAPVSRGEEGRLALHIAGVDFEDVRVKAADWQALKPNTPFGGLPVFEMPGCAPLAQSNAILVFIGRRHGLHPKDDLEAAYHE